MFDFNTNCREAYSRIIGLQFETGKAYLESEKRQNPDNLIPIVLDNYIDFLTVFIGEDKHEFSTRSANKQSRLRLLGAGDDHSPYKRWSQAMIHLQWSFARAKFGENFTAATEMRRAFLMLEANKKQFPDFVKNDIGMGLLYALVGTIPPQYQWVANLVSMYGSVPMGRATLYGVLEHAEKQTEDAYLKYEALFFLSFLEMHLMPDNTGAVQLVPLFEDAGRENLLLDYLHAELLMRLGRNEQAIDMLETRKGPGLGYFPFPYLDYLLAEAYLRRLETETAIRFYEKYLTTFNGINYRADAIRKKAWAYLLQGNTSNYQLLMNEVADTETGPLEADKQAVREARLQNPPHLVLLSARLLFDGGYYDKAIEVLDNAGDIASENDQLEFIYRKARIYHEMGRVEMARTYYYRSIEEGAASKTYYAANAALKLGELYESQGESEAALRAYRQCLAMKPDEYRDSIHAKAKAGISRLSK